MSDNASITLRILKEAETIHFDNNEIIFEESTPVQHVYIIIYGSVALKSSLLDGIQCTVKFGIGDCIFNFINIIENTLVILKYTLLFYSFYFLFLSKGYETSRPC